LAPNSMTLDDLERQNRRFYGILAISGCNTRYTATGEEWDCY